MRNILNEIGNTPLLKIQKLIPNSKVNIFVKLEGQNPSGSIKDRIALAMVKKAEKEGILTNDKTIIEPSSGNTGISLAMIGAVKGYKVKIVMPETVSIERRKIIKAFGADLILVKEQDWRDETVKFTKDLVKQNKNLVLLNQYENEANIKVHYDHTGREILEQMENRRIDIFVSGIGTGGTITGIGKKLKEKFPQIKIVGVQPKRGSKIEGLKSLKEGYIPPILNLKLVDEIIEVKDEEAYAMSRILAKKEGIFVGASAGAAMFVALKKAKEIFAGNIVVIFPDRGERYLSTNLFT